MPAIPHWASGIPITDETITDIIRIHTDHIPYGEDACYVPEDTCCAIQSHTVREAGKPLELPCESASIIDYNAVRVDGSSKYSGKHCVECLELPSQEPICEVARRQPRR